MCFLLEIKDVMLISTSYSVKHILPYICALFAVPAG
jgi:hypothetical protein